LGGRIDSGGAVKRTQDGVFRGPEGDCVGDRLGERRVGVRERDGASVKGAPVHASIWRFAGDPQTLLHHYERMLAEIPRANMRLHLCLRATDGILLVDTCPSREAFEAFSAGDEFRGLRMRHGLPEPEQVEDFPVHAAFLDGARKEGALG
jgi:hypothetical protein